MDGKYVPQGKLGCAVLGQHSTKDVSQSHKLRCRGEGRGKGGLRREGGGGRGTDQTSSSKILEQIALYNMPD